MGWKDNFAQGKELTLATCSNDNPNSNIVISLGFIDNKLLIADCSMQTTLKNLQQNPKICITSNYLRIKGKAEIFSQGKYFDICKEIVAKQDKTLKVKNAILITIENVFDLNKQEVLF